MRKLLAITFILGMFFSCGEAERFTVIKGKLINSQDTIVYLNKMTSQNFIQKASAKIDVNGEFTIKFKPEDTEFYMIRSQKNNLITLLIEPDEQIEVNINANNFSENYSVKGSVGSILIKKFKINL